MPEAAHLRQIVGSIGDQRLGRIGKGQHRHQHKAPENLNGDVIAANFRAADGVDDADDHYKIGDIADQAVGAAAQPDAQVLAHIGKSGQRLEVAKPDFLRPQQQQQPHGEEAGAGGQGGPADANHAGVQRKGVTPEKQAVQRQTQQDIAHRHQEYQRPQPQGLKQDDNGGGQDRKGDAEYADAEVGARPVLQLRSGSDQRNEGVAEYEHTQREGQGGQKDKRQDAFGPVELHRRAAAYLRTQEEENRQHGGFLENFHHQPDELPLGHDGQTAGVGYLGADEIDPVELIDVRQPQKEQDEQEQPPVPDPDAIPYVGQRSHFASRRLGAFGAKIGGVRGVPVSSGVVSRRRAMRP